ncbi:MAG: TetR/AcrR family transcriptional regulator [Alphaproteobacteria bacterium]
MTAQKAIQRRNLSRERILKAAMDIVNEHGIAALSTRNLGRELGVTSMAIYKHFDNKDALLSALLDAFIESADLLPDHDLPWDEWILYVGQRMGHALTAQPDWITLLGHIEMNQGGLNLMVEGLATLTRAGFTLDDALEAFFTLAHISIGAAFVAQGVQQLTADADSTRHDEEYFGILQNNFGALEPLIAAQQLEKGLHILIAGIRPRLTQNGHYE